MRCMRAGPRIVDANHLLDLLSFPSMHTAMAAMAVAYSRRTFAFSIFYLALLFAALMVDHYLPLVAG